MKPPSALPVLLVLAALLLLLHTLTNGQYGFHRDELATLDDARHLAWGYVAYPPLTPFVARLALELLGTGPAAVRFFTALAQCAVMVVAGLMAHELGGGRRAQIVAALAVAVSPVSMAAGHLFQYVSFDFLWAVLTVYFVIRLLNSSDGRWWMAMGVSIGLGLITRYTMAWLVAGLTVGFLLTPQRKLLMNRWLIAGMALAVAIVLPNLIWEARHGFISIDFLRSIHARDVRIGRTDGFLWKQLVVPASLFTIPLWIAGLFFYFQKPGGERYRALGWTFVAAMLLFVAAHARDYYSAPLYPTLLGAGAVMSDAWPRWARGLNWAALAAGLGVAALVLPLAPIDSRWFEATNRVDPDLREEIGWPDLVETVARIHDSLPAAERPITGIFTGNYGEAGAIDLYGPAHGLSGALSRANSFWLRGYGAPPPKTLIVVGVSRKFVADYFTSCEWKGAISNRFGVENDELHNDVWVCRGIRQSWPEFWQRIKSWQ